MVQRMWTTPKFNSIWQDPAGISHISHHAFCLSPTVVSVLKQLMRGRSRARALQVDEDDPASIRRYNRWSSSHLYNAFNRDKRNAKKQAHMSLLRAAQAWILQTRWKHDAWLPVNQPANTVKAPVYKQEHTGRFPIKALMYRCDPTFYPDPGEPQQPLPGQKMYLVCGQKVQAPGYYVSWPSADLQYKHVSGATLKGYYNLEELKDAWHARCDRGEHHHPADPVILLSLSGPGPSIPTFAPLHPPSTTLLLASSPVCRTPPTARTSVLPLHFIDSRSPSPQTPPESPPSYASSLPRSSPSPSPHRPAELAGLMCYAVRVGQEGETFTDISEARARFLALQNMGLSPSYIVSPSLTRCITWIEEVPASTWEREGWEQEEDRARCRRVASQRQRMAHRRTVLDALAVLREPPHETDDDSEGSELSCTTEDLEWELQAREVFGSSWRDFI
ncbi:hypothetical protein B0H13DRAFT_2320106 [Mycena leptocephala]|nr:hypothetical protein B0H13DRAFT_2320106 [Mycena leptocephala]